MTVRPAKVYSYLRFSTPEQALGDSKRRQVEAAHAWAEERGLVLDEELADEGVSGFRGANTRDDAALGAFLKAVQVGDVPEGSILIVESLDRLTRDRILIAQHTVTALLLAGISIVTLGDRREYSAKSVNANPTDLLVSLLVLMRANEESETKAKRLRAAWENKRLAASTGKRMTSTCPAWLKATPDGVGFSIIEERATVVRRIFEDTLGGKGQNRLAQELTSEGVPTWRGGIGWHRTYIRKILDNAAVIGELTPHVTERTDGGGTVRKPVGSPIVGYYPPVIDKELWDRVRARIGSGSAVGVSRRGRHAGKPIRHFLAGLATCPHCEQAMTRVTKGPKGGRALLVCARAKRGAGCIYRAVRVDLVEDAILRETVDLLDNPPSVEGAVIAMREEARNLDYQIAAMVEERADIARKRRSNRVLLPVERQREAELYRQQQALEDRRKAVQDLLGATGSRLVDSRIARLWDSLEALEGDDRAEINAAMRETFSQVVVDHRVERLFFHWRHGGISELPYGTPFGNETE